ncbi:hypothetical protein M885DRAFT_531821 [Pelagophyceae sp. CCMP2097]|nr:hypothetical protein M885DRAFT_531821 [Pelagophyceae sp. CCMP2097]
MGPRKTRSNGHSRTRTLVPEPPTARRGGPRAAARPPGAPHARHGPRKDVVDVAGVCRRGWSLRLGRPCRPRAVAATHNESTRALETGAPHRCDFRGMPCSSAAPHARRGRAVTRAPPRALHAGPRLHQRTPRTLTAAGLFRGRGQRRRRRRRRRLAAQPAHRAGHRREVSTCSRAAAPGFAQGRPSGCKVAHARTRTRISSVMARGVHLRLLESVSSNL